MTAHQPRPWKPAPRKGGRPRAAAQAVTLAAAPDLAPTPERQQKGMTMIGKSLDGSPIWRDDSCTPLHQALKAGAILQGHFDAGERWLLNRRAVIALNGSGGAPRDSLDMTPRGAGETRVEWALRVSQDDRAARARIPADLLGAVEAFVVREERVTRRFDMRERWWRDVFSGLGMLAMFYGIEVRDPVRAG